jgi:hypothetical protein
MISDWNDHVYGMCYTSTSSDFMYINISKNASTWTNQLFQLSLNFTLHNWVAENFFKTPIIVLRDPVDRWCSGMAEYLVRNKIFSTDEVFLRQYLTKFTWDEHTEKQMSFLPNLNNTNSIYFYVDSNYEQNIKKFILKDMGRKNWWNAELSSLKKRKNRSKDKNMRDELKKVFLTFAKEPDFLQNLQDYYKLDYELINSVTFYS